eukprot:2419098-Prymnesium_polylepis.1
MYWLAFRGMRVDRAKQVLGASHPRSVPPSPTFRTTAPFWYLHSSASPQLRARAPSDCAHSDRCRPAARALCHRPARPGRECGPRGGRRGRHHGEPDVHGAAVAKKVPRCAGGQRVRRGA